MVRAGLTPAQVLSTATRAPSEFANLSNDLGAIEAGKVADMVLLEANPLVEINNTRKINMVIAAGRLLDRAELDDQLALAQSAVKTH